MVFETRDSLDTSVDPPIRHYGRTVLAEHHYYPFGMLHFNRYSQPNGKDDNRYLYNGKELQESLEHDWEGARPMEVGFYQYGARNYDAPLVIWPTMDPHAENYYAWSPYNYVVSNPITRTDPRGMDWEITKDKETGKTTYNYHLTAALLNTSGNQNLDLTTLLTELLKQTNVVYNQDIDDKTSITFSATIDIIKSIDDLKDNQHLIEVVVDKVVDASAVHGKMPSDVAKVNEIGCI